MEVPPHNYGASTFRFSLRKENSNLSANFQNVTQPIKCPCGFVGLTYRFGFIASFLGFNGRQRGLQGFPGPLILGEVRPVFRSVHNTLRSINLLRTLLFAILVLWVSENLHAAQGQVVSQLARGAEG